MNRKVQILILGFICLFAGTGVSDLTAMYIGTIQFPRIVQKVPSLRVYFAGNKIACSNNNENKQTTFTIPSYQRNTPLYILVTEHVQWNAEENTIKYLKTDMRKSYKLYLATPREVLPGKKADNNECTPSWDIQEVSLEADGKIPDNAIIVVFNPDLIDTLEGGNSITLPKLCIRSNILELVGTEGQLHTMTESLLLSSLDSDSIHKQITRTVKPYYQLKTVLALTT